MYPLIIAFFFTCSSDFIENGLSVGYLQRSEVSLDAVLSSDTIMEDFNVQLSHATQNGLRMEREGVS